MSASFAFLIWSSSLWHRGQVRSNSDSQIMSVRGRNPADHAHFPQQIIKGFGRIGILITPDRYHLDKAPDMGESQYRPFGLAANVDVRSLRLRASYLCQFFATEFVPYLLVYY